MLLQLLATPAPIPAPQFDLWGAEIPAWIASVGGIATVVVSIWALVTSLKTRNSLGAVAANANATAAPYSAAYVPSVTWKIESDNGRTHRHRLVNTGDTSALVLEVSDISDGDRNTLQVSAPELPRTVAPGEFVVLDSERSLVSPYLIRGRVTWREHGQVSWWEFLLT